MEDETLDSVRFTFQRVLTPIVVIIGCVGNAISVLVLTRRRMRCSTNVYLTALAISDIIFLLFVLLLSLRHHHALHQAKYSLYWKMYGLSVWICDAAAYTSIWLIVSFTIERYIAICHPIRGHVLCTESRAKKVIAVCFVMCFLLTVSRVFEYQVKQETRFFTLSNIMCPTPNKIETTTTIIDDSTMSVPEELISTSKQSMTELIENMDNEYNHNILKRSIEEVTRSPITYSDNNTYDKMTPPKLKKVDGEWCEEREYLNIAISDFGKNDTYRNTFYVLIIILFMFGPLILLAIFNCYLIAAVHRSRRLRKVMTNNSHGSGGDSSQMENKITIILIAVCVLFLLCQIPSAFGLLYIIIAKPDSSNVMLALGNVFNFLVLISAASNFILYCVLSDKYRHTVRQILCGLKDRQRQSVDSQMSKLTSVRSSGGNSSSPDAAIQLQSINERKKFLYNGDPPSAPPTTANGGGNNGGKQLKFNINNNNKTPATIDEGLE